MSVVVPAFSKQKDGAGEFGKPTHQILGILLTLGVSIPSGVLTGLVMKGFGKDSNAFDDSMFWSVADEEVVDYYEEDMPLTGASATQPRPNTGCLDCTRKDSNAFDDSMFWSVADEE